MKNEQRISKLYLSVLIMLFFCVFIYSQENNISFDYSMFFSGAIGEDITDFKASNISLDYFEKYRESLDMTVLLPREQYQGGGQNI